MYEEGIYMIIVSGGTKGGSGKTTLATNLAVMRSEKGYDVLLIDADDQESATDFTVVRNDRMQEGAGYTSIKLTGSQVRTETLRLKDKYQDIIIDVGGRDTQGQRAALTVADVFLIPFRPRSLDVWTVGKVCSLIAEMSQANPKLKAFAFINCADPRGNDNEEAAELLKNKEELTFINTPLGNRKAFSNAATDGLAVTEYRPEDLKAVEEVATLYEYVFGIK